MIQSAITPDSRKVVYDRVVALIRSEGIPSYVAAWEPPVPFREFEKDKSDEAFLEALSEQVVKKYHFHSKLIYHKDDPVGKRKAPRWGKKPPLIELIDDGRVGLIRFFACSRYDGDKAALDEQVAAVATALRQWIKSRMIDGLVLDLRRHTGGDIYPFSVGLAGVLKGVTMYSWGNVPASRKRRTWEINDGESSGRPQAFTTDRLRCAFPVAVLVGPKTASAGEADAAIFYNKPRVKTFGQDTAGRLSGNHVLPVFGNIEIALTGALVTTTDGTFHVDQLIRPNVYTKRPLRDAVFWISSEQRVRAEKGRTVAARKAGRSSG